MIIVIISGIVAFLALIIMIIKIKNNKLNVYEVKIEEAEIEIEKLLEKKFSILSELQSIFKERESQVEFNLLCNLEDVEEDEFKLNSILNKAYKELKDFIEEKRSFIPDDEIKEKLDKLYNVDIECIATKEYYNDNAILLNNKIKKFPNNILAKFKGITTREVYNDPIEEEFEILKKK